MLDNYLLTELVTFAKNGTLAKTAAELNVTQPTVTRGMQKLEADLNVRLFERQPNRITLTATGRLAAQQAEKLLAQQQTFVAQVQNFDRRQTRLQIETTLPGPLLLVDHLKPQLAQPLQIDRSLISNDAVIQHLESYRASLVFSNQELLTSTVSSQFLGTENLIVHLQKFMYQANQTSITFDELHGLSFIVLDDIGSWKQISQQAIPDAKFLYQQQQSAFQEITAYSAFPFFSTNLSPLRPDNADQLADDDRVAIPISDTSAHMPIYVNYLTSQRTTLQPLITMLREHWPN